MVLESETSGKGFGICLQSFEARRIQRLKTFMTLDNVQRSSFFRPRLGQGEAPAGKVKRGDAASKRYGRWLRNDMGITDRRVVAHSWRHWMEDRLREVETPDEVADSECRFRYPKAYTR